MSKSNRKQLAATAKSEQSRTRLDVVKDWLNSNYVVRVNLLDRSKVSLSPTETCAMQYEHPVTEEDILLHAFADELPIPRQILKMLLANPNQMQSFNPIRDYLKSLQGKYKGPSQIDLLCRSLHVSEEKGGRQAEQRAASLLRKWIIATAACALGIRQNDVALGLVGDKAGIGKTTFFENLVPGPLKEYYQVAMKEDRLFTLHNAFAQRFLLNFDEFAAINGTNWLLSCSCRRVLSISNDRALDTPREWRGWLLAASLPTRTMRRGLHTHTRPRHLATTGGHRGGQHRRLPATV